MLYDLQLVQSDQNQALQIDVTLPITNVERTHSIQSDLLIRLTKSDFEWGLIDPDKTPD